MPLPPPDEPERCELCGEPVVPYTETIAAFNQIDYSPNLDGEPIHVPRRRASLFFWGCGSSS